MNPGFFVIVIMIRVSKTALITLKYGDYYIVISLSGLDISKRKNILAPDPFFR